MNKINLKYILEPFVQKITNRRSIKSSHKIDYKIDTISERHAF